MDFTSFTSISPRKRQRYLIVVLILIIFVIVFLVWNFFLAGPRPLLFEPIPPPEIKINFEILESPALNELQLYEEISPFEGEIGRENPFIPY